MKLTHKATAFAFAIMFTGQVFGATLPENITSVASSNVTSQNVVDMAQAYRLAIIANKGADLATKKLIIENAQDFSRKLLLTATNANDFTNLRDSIVKTYIAGAINVYLKDLKASQELEALLDAQYPTFAAVAEERQAALEIERNKQEAAVNVENVVKQNIVEIVEIDKEGVVVTPATPSTNLLQFIPLVDNFTSTTNVETAAVDSVVKPTDVATQVQEEQAPAQQEIAQEAPKLAQKSGLSTYGAIALGTGIVGATVYALDGGARILNLDTNGNGVSDIDEAYNALINTDFNTDLNGNGVADITDVKEAADNAYNSAYSTLVAGYNSAYNTLANADLNDNGVADVTEIKNASDNACNSAYSTLVAGYNSAYNTLANADLNGNGVADVTEIKDAAVAAKEAVMYELGKGSLPTSHADALAKAAREQAAEAARQAELARIAALEQAAREKANSADGVADITDVKEAADNAYNSAYSTLVAGYNSAYNTLANADLNDNGVADVTEIKNASDNACNSAYSTLVAGYNSAYNTLANADLNGNGVADVTEIKDAAVAAKEAVMYELGKGSLPTSHADALAKAAREQAAEAARQAELARIAALEQAAREKANSAGCVSWIRSWFNDCPVQK